MQQAPLELRVCERVCKRIPCVNADLSSTWRERVLAKAVRASVLVCEMTVPVSGRARATPGVASESSLQKQRERNGEGERERGRGTEREREGEGEGEREGEGNGEREINTIH